MNETIKGDAVSHPPHYSANPGGIECIDVTEWMNFNRGNAVKYLWRAGAKDPAMEIQDLEKAIWYIQREIDRIKYMERRGIERNRNA